MLFCDIVGTIVRLGDDVKDYRSSRKRIVHAMVTLQKEGVTIPHPLSEEEDEITLLRDLITSCVQPPDWITDMFGKQKIESVKALRDHYGLTLREAMRLYDLYAIKT